MKPSLSEQTELETVTTTPYPSRGLRLEVLRPADRVDCTLNGISSRANGLICVGVLDHRRNPAIREAAPLRPDMQLWEATPTSPAVLLHVRQIGHPVFSLIPAVWMGDHWEKGPEDLGFYCAGGNYAATTDGRFGDLTAEFQNGARFYGALSVHDRLESYMVDRLNRG